MPIKNVLKSSFWKFTVVSSLMKWTSQNNLKTQIRTGKVWRILSETQVQDRLDKNMWILYAFSLVNNFGNRLSTQYDRSWSYNLSALKIVDKNDFFSASRFYLPSYLGAGTILCWIGLLELFGDWYVCHWMIFLVETFAMRRYF